MLEPTVLAKKLKLKIYNPGKISDFVFKELPQNQSKNLIVGQSNTNPILINEIKINFMFHCYFSLFTFLFYYPKQLLQGHR